MTRRVGPEALDDAADALADAFDADPLFDWFLRADARRPAARRRLFGFLLGEIGFPQGEVTLADDARGAAVWLPPGPAPPTPLWRELAALPTLAHATGLARFGRLARLRAAMAAHHPEGPFAYLWFLGVRRTAQGKGVGSALLDATLAPLDAAGLGAFLETATARNLPLYQSRGFQISARYRPAPGAPDVWAMQRAPV